MIEDQLAFELENGLVDKSAPINPESPPSGSSMTSLKTRMRISSLSIRFVSDVSM
jgi:hypothetical protein